MSRRFRRSRLCSTQGSCTLRRMRGLLVLLFVLSACTLPPPAAHHEVILTVTNNRDEPLIIRVVPRLLQITGPPAPRDMGEGQGEGPQGPRR